jgi:hypothetical protein
MGQRPSRLAGLQTKGQSDAPARILFSSALIAAREFFEAFTNPESSCVLASQSAPAFKKIGDRAASASQQGECSAVRAIWPHNERTAQLLAGLSPGGGG